MKIQQSARIAAALAAPAFALLPAAHAAEPTAVAPPTATTTVLAVLNVPASAPLRTPRFQVVDPVTRQPLSGASVTVEDAHTLVGGHTPLTLRATIAGTTPALDTAGWKPMAADAAIPPTEQTVVLIPAGTSVLLYQQTPPKAGAAAGPPIKDIYIKVTATRAQVHASQTSAGTTRDNTQLRTFTNPVGNDPGALTRGQSGVASDSNGQQHVRGEHADISFVVDGVPLPDTLSGRQGSIVVPSTIESLDMLTGGFAPEFGGQTAAVLDITTLPGAKKLANSLAFETGSYGTANTDFASSGPLGSKASYVFDFSDARSNNALEPQQPDKQSAHNGGDDQSFFAKFRVAPTAKDTVTLTLSHAPNELELSNRTGLGSRFASAGQGYGFLGLRNADGTRPDVAPGTIGVLGAQVIPLGSQEDDGMSILQHEVNEFVSLAYRRQFDTYNVARLSEVILHSAQDVTNANPAVSLNALPIDNSIEYNPTAHRSVYHYQLNGDFTTQKQKHALKVGFLSDQETGDESYTIVPASQLALDELEALSANLAPDGSTAVDATGATVRDVDGNPVYVAAAGATSPTLKVHRSGFYDAAYIQDTWKATTKLTANYGLRYDRFHSGQNLGQPIVDKSQFSPRVNLSYALVPGTVVRGSFDHLFNIPPLAQGAVVGEPIQPEIVDQYDGSVERQIARGQTVKAAYYYKEIHDQVDTGLLIPGSQIGLYSAVNFQYGAVHGLELSYDFSPPGGVGWDGYLNYTNSRAQPNGLDNTGVPVPQFNDHDQRHTVGAGLAYLWKSGATVATTLNYGSGLASSPIPPSTTRIARTSVDLHTATSPHLLYGGHGGLGFDVTNVFDDRSVINFQSAFSGTRFVEGRRLLISTFVNF